MQAWQIIVASAVAAFLAGDHFAEVLARIAVTGPREWETRDAQLAEAAERAAAAF